VLADIETKQLMTQLFTANLWKAMLEGEGMDLMKQYKFSIDHKHIMILKCFAKFAMS
jgi:hypothetical protein